MTKEALEILFEKYYKGECSPDETALVNTLLDKYVKNSRFDLDIDEKKALLHNIQQRIQDELGIPLGEESNNKPKNEPIDIESGHLAIKKGRLFILRNWWAAAAAAVVILFLGTYFYFGHKESLPKQLVARSANIEKVKPGTTSASLLLANGQAISLDSSRAGNIRTIEISNGSVCLLNKNGQKLYLNRTASLNVYNSLVTARGQQAPEMTLSDGTKVWLNASSVLRFPVQFSGNTREVSLTGEAYFEVAKDASHPFIVKAGSNNIRVLGTHFDVMAYQDEPYSHATLLEGSIVINNSNSNAKLTPGQQGIISDNGKINVENVDADQSVAWLHGMLPMDNMDVHAFLREVSRWYDVDIVYKNQIQPQTFSGNLKRDVPLEHILSALKANGIQCELKNRTILISK